MYLHPVDKIIRINNESTSTALICIANGSSSYFWERKDGNIQSNAEGIGSNNLILHKHLVQAWAFCVCLPVPNW